MMNINDLFRRYTKKNQTILDTVSRWSIFTKVFYINVTGQSVK